MRQIHGQLAGDISFELILETELRRAFPQVPLTIPIERCRHKELQSLQRLLLQFEYQPEEKYIKI